MDDAALLKRKILDQANRAFTQNIYTYTDFLSLNELDVYYRMKNELSFIYSEAFGGNPVCERQVIQFGSKELFGYAGTFPIQLLCITPLIEKFAEPLTHRDYLGALMNLGISRGLLGDIIVEGSSAYLYCMNHISDFIIENLHTVRHTHVKCMESKKQLPDAAPVFETFEMIAASPRLDAVVSGLTGLSRSHVLELFHSRKIFLNGRCMENNSAQLKPNDILVIRGTGKYIYEDTGSQTKKGRVYVRLKKYV